MNSNDNKGWTPKIGERVIAEDRGCGGGKHEGVVLRQDQFSVLVEYNDGWQGGHPGGAADIGIKNRWWHAPKQVSPIDKPLQIIADRYYKTRDGRKVGPVRRGEGGSTFWYVPFLAEGYLPGFYENGSFYAGREFEFDIIAECEEPVPPAALFKVESGKFYKLDNGRKVGPMESWGDYEHQWQEAGGSREFNKGGDQWRDDGTSSYSPAIIAEWPADEPVAVAVPTPKFKVGDRVRTLKPWGDCTKIGDVGVIDEVCDHGVTVKIDAGDGFAWFYRFNEVEPAPTLPPTPTAIVCLIENGQPLPASRPYIHTTAGAARREAERLADNHKGQAFGVYVLQGEPALVAKPEYKHEWQRLAADGQKVAAVQALRAVADIGLKAAKDAVEDWRSRNVQPKPWGCEAA